MNSTKTSRIFLGAIAIAAFTFSLAMRAQAQTETILYSLGGGSDGQDPAAGLIFDAAGNLYGTSIEGGGCTRLNAGCGSVFEMSPNGSGGWTEKVLYGCSGGADGLQPEGTLVLDTAGNLYGTTQVGGTCCGVVFKLTHNSDGSWTQSVLYTFAGGSDGSEPVAGLVFDAAGNLYGTTQEGGGGGCGIIRCGTVFELTPNSSGGGGGKILPHFSRPRRGPLPPRFLFCLGLE